ncbi:MAG: 3-dehydroquinate dehydratase [Bacteroidetes bacterium]|nr:MAG: 3-dehydroquinate dehydratase [Bacteroidota bacterium]TAE72884.1 MAG: 3-dehydroquinate dehydratase [Bacteroidota bacterium]TAF94024.1 MAG: 3-dehydroquinate dehydratase [Bacteroidota bacterium]
MQKIVIINGPNLNLLGLRETQVYGTESFEAYFEKLKRVFPSVELVYLQSNVEGELINYLHAHGFDGSGIVINPGGYTHTSVALGDAIAGISSPVVEVHISNVHAREAFRQLSHVSAKCKGTISGMGLYGYQLAVQYLLQL